MQASAKIKSQQLLQVKSTETVQGPNQGTGERVYPRRVLSYICSRVKMIWRMKGELRGLNTY